MCLLASGGHCQLALVKAIDEFLLLGTSQHNSPGELLDKVIYTLEKYCILILVKKEIAQILCNK